MDVSLTVAARAAPALAGPRSQRRRTGGHRGPRPPAPTDGVAEVTHRLHTGSSSHGKLSPPRGLTTGPSARDPPVFASGPPQSPAPTAVHREGDRLVAVCEHAHPPTAARLE